MSCGSVTDKISYFTAHEIDMLDFLVVYFSAIFLKAKIYLYQNLHVNKEMREVTSTKSWKFKHRKL